MFPLRLGRRWLRHVAVALLAVAPAAGAAAGPSLPSAAERLRQEGLALAARDDTASQERAAEQLDEASRANPVLYQARADRALVELLAAAARREEAVRLSSGDGLMQSGRALREQALDELRPLVRDHPSDPAVVRALAVYYGLEGNAAQTARLVERARAAGTPDPWIDFAELAAALRNTSPDAAVLRLAAFVTSHPGLLRARMMLARAQLDLSRSDDSLLTLDEILAANPDHDLAQQLKARILSPPPARVTVVPLLRDGPPPRPPGYLPHKRSSDGGDAARRSPAFSVTGADGVAR